MRLCSPDQLRVEERDGKVSFTIIWPPSSGTEPYLSVEACFAFVIELGRRGTGKHVVPLTMNLRRPEPSLPTHTHYFDCSIRYGAARDQLTLSATDLSLSFREHNPLKLLALYMDLKTVYCNRSMSSNPIASAIFGTDKALIIQGFVVSGIQEIGTSLYGSFPHLFGHFHNPALLTPLRPPLSLVNYISKHTRCSCLRYSTSPRGVHSIVEMWRIAAKPPTLIERFLERLAQLVV
ncbi:AraC family transcriptional regulator ligand-binding domain-containing protein [Pseudomonas brassicae]|nr:AraC family transcriptional regulator ligand-binding domain-containing protein [Pseudomonas brassicae]